MLPGEAELVSEWTGLSGRAKSVKRFERPNHGVLIINLESQLRLAAEVTGNSLSALLASHSYHVHTHICVCLRTLGLYISIVNLTVRHCLNDGSMFILTKCQCARHLGVNESKLNITYACYNNISVGLSCIVLPNRQCLFMQGLRQLVN